MGRPCPHQSVLEAVVTHTTEPTRLEGPQSLGAFSVMNISSLPPELAERILTRLGNNTYVVMNKDHTALLQDPGQNQPYHHTNKKAAEIVAREVGGHVATFQEAFQILTKNNPLS